MGSEPLLIDTMHLGLDRVIGAHLIRGVIVDPGPASALDNWIDSLDEPPRALLLTHIHLDHAGASGVLARRFPDLRVYVSEVGAPHVIDPEKLLASAGRLYGEENMKRLWGEVAPVPAERVSALADGDEVEGMRVLHTPGHAGHHVSYVDVEAGDAYVGDAAGVRIEPSDLVLPPTPPPEVDLEAWFESLDKLEAARPTRLHLTHFGAADPSQIGALRERLRENAELAKAGDREAFLEAFEARIDDEADGDTGVRMREATPPDQQWLGLERYWRKRQGPK
jgi:glyoxylase-like metal-dependent hydrolase (beta-lactamase superfamily II)